MKALVTFTDIDEIDPTKATREVLVDIPDETLVGDIERTAIRLGNEALAEAPSQAAYNYVGYELVTEL